MYTPKVIITAFMLVCICVCCGCTIARVKINQSIEQMDTAWIQPGSTDYQSVINKLGMPPPVGSVDSAPAFFSDKFLHYLALDTKVYKLSVGYIFTPVFERTRTVAEHDILIRFNDAGIVTQISRVRRTSHSKPEVLEFREVAQ